MSRGERALAVLLGLTLLVGLLGVRHHHRLHQPSGLTATVTGHRVGTVERVGYVAFDLRISGTPTAALTGEVQVSTGWQVTQDPDLAAGSVLRLTHLISCDPVRQPPVLRVRAVDRRLLPVRVVEPQAVDLCDPLTGAAALKGGSTSLSQDPTTLELEIENYSTTDLMVERLRYDGFRIAAVLPQTVPGRLPGPLVLPQLLVARLSATFSVSDCARARASLSAAKASAEIDGLPFVASGQASSLTVPGLESYLETLWRRTCVR